MEIQIPLILFTTLLAWSAGLFATQAFYVMKGKAASTQMIAVIASLVLLAVGGVSVLFHLQHALRIFNGFGNPTSGITQELIALVILAILMVIYFIMLCRSNDGTVPRWLCICSIIFSVVLVVVCAHSYMMGARPAWNTIFQVGSLLGAFCGFGPATMAALCYSGNLKTRFNNFVHKVIKTYTVGIDLSLPSRKDSKENGKADKKDADSKDAKDTKDKAAEDAKDASAEEKSAENDKKADDANEKAAKDASAEKKSAKDDKIAAAEVKDTKKSAIAAAVVAAGSEDVAELTGKLNFIAQIADAVLVILYIIAMTLAAGEFTQVGYYFDPTGPTRGLKDTSSYTPWSMKALPVTIIILVFLAVSIFAAVKGKKDGNWKKWSIVIIVAVLIVAICVRVLFYILGISVYSFTDLEV